MPERVYDKINYQTNFTSTSTFAILLKAIKDYGVVDSDYARSTLFPTARSNAGMRWDATLRDTHGEITLAQYGLISYETNRTFKLSPLGFKFLELFDDRFQVKPNNDYNYVSTMLDALLSWNDNKNGRRINVGLLLLSLFTDSRLNYFITAEEWSYVAEFSNIKTNKETDDIISDIIINRIEGVTFPLKKADVFLGGFVGTWKILDKYDDNGVIKYKLSSLAKEIVCEKLKIFGLIDHFDIDANSNSYDYEDPSINQGGKNIIYYGTPGCGKSHYVDLKYNVQGNKVFRTVFHPEYSFTDFVGQIIPKIDKENDNSVYYEFNLGIFTEAFIYAIKNKKVNVVLIIEEINRGNAAAIFGEIFQLLDRDSTGLSKFEIDNQYISLEAFKDDKKKIKLPRNFSIIATMNTSDQNVYTLDTAFKRRWDMVKIRNTFDDIKDDPVIPELEYKKKISKMYIPNSNVSWKDFLEKVNTKISEKDKSFGINSEDKELGVYFVGDNYLCDHEYEKDPKKLNLFAEKVLMYIWNDVAKIDPKPWFGDCETLDKVLSKFEDINSNNSLLAFNGLFVPAPSESIDQDGDDNE